MSSSILNGSCLTIPLPDAASDLLELALNDFEAALRAGAIPNMSQWYRKVPHGCEVCLAGAILFQHGDLQQVEKSLDESGKIIEVTDAFLAIDDFRKGYWLDGFRMLNIALTPVQRDALLAWYGAGHNWIHYATSGHSRFVDNLRLFILRLRSLGL